MAFEDALVTLSNNEVCQLRREEPPQLSCPFKLGELIGDPYLQPAVQFRHFLGALPQFAQEPRVFHRDDRLRREVAQ